MIRETRSEQELRRRLDEVNRDNILQEDEMEQFVSLLMNQKTIREATNQADLDKAITNIERSKLVTREEFAIFLEDMQNRSFDREQVSEQLRVRSLMATTLSKLEADRTLNIAGIQNAESISEAEFEVLKKDKGREAESWDLEAMVYGRQYVFERQILLDEQERKRTENNFELEQAQHKNKLGAVEIEGKRQDDEYADERTRTKDEYKDERKVKEHKIDIDIEDDNYQREQRKKEDEDRREQKKKEDEARLKQQELENDLNRTERLSRLAAENMQKMKDAELELKKEEHAHDLERQKEDNAHEEEIIRITEATRQKEIEAEQQMNAGQLMAKRVAEMDPEAQAKFAESFSHLNEIELTKANAEQQKELYEKMIKMANDHNIDTKNIQAENSKQQMDVLQKMIDSFTSINTAQAGGQKDLIKTMVDAIQTVAKGKIDDELKLKEEYREQMHHEQERTDENQRQSLNYTTHVKQSENNSFMSGRSSSVNVNINITTCPSCGEPIQDQNSNCCPLCGKSLK